MYFSRVQLNPQRRKTREALANPQTLHAMVASSLPPDMQTSDAGRLLWRVDRDGHDVRLYVVSPHEPSFEHIIEQAGWAAAPPQTTDYARFLSRLTRGQEYGFRVTLNPVKQQRVPGARGKRLPLCREEEQIEWLSTRSQTWGFAIPDLAPSLDTIADDSAAAPQPAVKIVGVADRTFAKGRSGNRQQVTQRHVTFVGRLEIEDAQQMRHFLTHGMGRGKAYGCGLMTLALDG